MVEKAGKDVIFLVTEPNGSHWIFSCPDGADPTVTTNWVVTQLPPIPTT